MAELLQVDDGLVRLDVITVIYNIKEDGDGYSFAVSESGTLFKITDPDIEYIKARRQEVIDKITAL